MNQPEAPLPRPTTPPARARRRGILVVAALGLVAATVLGTVLVEHRIHGTGHEGHEGHEDHEGHEGDDHGEKKETDEHGDEHVDKVELSDAQLAAADVKLATAQAGKVVVTAELPGELALNGETMAHVGPRVSGTVRKINKKLGDTVKKGDVLAVLDSADVAEMHGLMRAARERQTLAEGNYERKNKLYKEKIVSKKDYLEAKQAYAEARVQYRSAKRSLAAKTGGGGAGGGYALVAPLAGVIVAWHIGVGEVLSEDTRAYTIGDLSSVWVNVTVYAKELPRVRVGQRVLVRADGISEPTEGRISYLSHTVGRLTRSATARIVLEKPGAEWRPGLFVTAEVEIDEVSAKVVVPEAAVQRFEGRRVVFVREGAALEVRPVELGRHGHSGETRVVEVVKGLQAGEQFVAANSFLIKAELGKASAGHQH